MQNRINQKKSNKTQIDTSTQGLQDFNLKVNSQDINSVSALIKTKCFDYREVKPIAKEEEISQDISPYEAMDLVDEAQMVNEIEGKFSSDEAMVYSFRDKATGKEITGLSWRRHKERYQEKIINTTSQETPSCPLPILNNMVPPLEGDEINRLAKSWCELILGQMIEQGKLSASGGAIIMD